MRRVLWILIVVPPLLGLCWLGFWLSILGTKRMEDWCRRQFVGLFEQTFKRQINQMNASAGAKAMADGDNTKNQNHMKKLLLMVAVAVVLALVSAWAVHHDYYKHSAPPPGWAIVCDGQGHFGAKVEDSGYVMTWYGGDDEVAYSRQQAINSAWRQYEFIEDLTAHPNIPKHGVWQDCDR